jgi:hypothetical protein
LTSEKATLVTHMSVGRVYAVSIVIDKNTLWVTGGENEGFHFTMGMNSTEYVKITGTMFGPDLPMALFKHAMVAINSTFSMVIGGGITSESYTSSLEKTISAPASEYSLSEKLAPKPALFSIIILCPL